MAKAQNAEQSPSKAQNDVVADTKRRVAELEAGIAAAAKAVIAGANESQQMLGAGKICEYAHDLELAMRRYQAAVAADRQNHEASARLALTQLKMGRTDEGLEAALQLSTAAPDFRFKSLGGMPISAMTVVGDALASKGDGAGALKAYRQAMEVEPDDRYSAGRAAELLLGEGKLKEAAALADRIGTSSRFDEVRAVLKLSSNDPKLLPSVFTMRRGSIGVLKHV